MRDVLFCCTCAQCGIGESLFFGEKNVKNFSTDKRKVKNEADRKMVKSLDVIPKQDRLWGH